MAHRGGATGRVGLSLGWVLGLGAACSTIASEEPGPECEIDVDCPDRWQCDLNQGGVCVPVERARRGVLAFSIEEAAKQFEAHLRACDDTVEIGSSKLELDFIDAEEFKQKFALRAISTKFLPNCEEECAGECDADGNCTQPISVDFSVWQESRIGLPTPDDVDAAYPPIVEEQPTDAPATFLRPRYPEDDLALGSALEGEDGLSGGRPTILEIKETDRAPFLRALDPQLPAAGEVTIVRDRDCDVGFKGQVRIYESLDGVEQASVEARFAEPVATPSTVVLADGSEPASCQDDESCGSGWACNDQGTCGLDLTGVVAGTTMTQPESSGIFDIVDPLRVHVYCEEGVTSRQFDMTVRPPVNSGLPTVNYEIDQEIDFGVAGLEINQSLDGDLCIPDWRAPHVVSFEFGGTPLQVKNAAGEGACCDVDCLSSPDPNITDCRPFSRIRFETHLTLPDDPDEAATWAQDWEADNCMPVRAEDGVIGGYRPEIGEECTSKSSQCEIALTEGEEGQTRTYRISVSQPNGSFFRSQRFTRQVTAETTELDKLQFQPRLRITGSVCNPQLSTEDEPCLGGQNAVVMAERIRMASDTDVFGPTFFETVASDTGSFVLPVDPGVYVVTALPAPGVEGGPARFEMLDLRPESLEEDGLTGNVFDKSFELGTGLTVTVNMSEFDFNAKLLPVDWGSWAHQDEDHEFLAPDGTPIDLNDADTCYGGTACTIRKLRTAPVSPLLSKRAQFTMRDRGPESCED